MQSSDILNQIRTLSIVRKQNELLYLMKLLHERCDHEVLYKVLKEIAKCFNFCPFPSSWLGKRVSVAKSICPFELTSILQVCLKHINNIVAEMGDSFPIFTQFGN